MPTTLQPGLYYLPERLKNPTPDRRKKSWQYATTFWEGYYLLAPYGQDSAGKPSDEPGIYESDSRGSRSSHACLHRVAWPDAYELLAQHLRPVHPQSYEVQAVVTLTLTPGMTGTTDADARNIADAALRQVLESDLDRDNWCVKFSLLSHPKVRNAQGINYR